VCPNPYVDNSNVIPAIRYINLELGNGRKSLVKGRKQLLWEGLK